ncbi:MAG: transposase [Planctomycetota bacterium]
MSNQKPIRKQPVHGVLRLNQPTIVFVTVCTRDRRKLLTRDAVRDALLHAWNQADAWRIGRYVIMPDHIHLFAGLMDERFDLDQWVRYWKSLAAKSIAHPDFKWQSGYWATRMRNAQQYESKWEDVKNNAVRHGLVEKACDWPYAGVIANLYWD